LLWLFFLSFLCDHSQTCTLQGRYVSRGPTQTFLFLARASQLPAAVQTVTHLGGGAPNNSGTNYNLLQKQRGPPTNPPPVKHDRKVQILLPAQRKSNFLPTESLLNVLFAVGFFRIVRRRQYQLYTRQQLPGYLNMSQAFGRRTFLVLSRTNEKSYIVKWQEKREIEREREKEREREREREREEKREKKREGGREIGGLAQNKKTASRLSNEVCKRAGVQSSGKLASRF
jgi:hypothetical protein